MSQIENVRRSRLSGQTSFFRIRIGSRALRLVLAACLGVVALVIVSAIEAQRRTTRSADSSSLKSAQSHKVKKRSGNFDIRLLPGELMSKLESLEVPSGQAEVQAELDESRRRLELRGSQLKASHENAEIKVSPLTGGVEVLRDPKGLTPPAPGVPSEAIIRSFLSENRDIYGLSERELSDLNFIGESVSRGSGLRMVRVEQIINGRPVFQSETRFILDEEGKLIRSMGLMAPRVSDRAAPLSDLLTPEIALQRTMERRKVSFNSDKIHLSRSEQDGFQAELKVDDPRIRGRVTSRLVYFPLAPGTLIPAWSQVIFGVDEDWYELADARDGSRLWAKQIRNDASTHDARFRVFVQADGITPADNPAPHSPTAAIVGAATQYAGIAPTIVSMFLAQNLIASPNGWINDCPGGVCTANETQTLGNNTLVCVDRTSGESDVCDTTGIQVLDGNGRPTGNPDTNGRNRDFLGTSPRDFETSFLPAPQGGDPEAGTSSSSAGPTGAVFLRGSAVQQFYVTNWYHDRLFALGFNPAAGNFQNDNFGGGGFGNDRVLVDVQDGQSDNNANFSTPSDGISGRAQMFNFTGPTVDRDGGLDTEILIHELTHGTSNRIIGNAAGLQWDIGGGMGEGWSDFYALALLNSTNADNPDANYASGAYATYKIGGPGYLDNYVYGIRRFPYSTNNAINPLTWADVDQTTYNHSGGIAVSPLGFQFAGAGEVHNVGEIWALTLWEVRSRIIAASGGNIPLGNEIALQLVTDGMKMTPANPTYIQARDALIDADCATNACVNEESIWGGFADRGLGYGAKVPNSVTFTPVAPHVGVVESFQSPGLDINAISVSDGNLSGFVDPNEPFSVNVNLKNPWRAASKTATSVTVSLTSSTPGVAILTGSTTYPNIGPNSNQDRSGVALAARAPSGGSCGGRLDFTLTISSSLGVVVRPFTIRMGQPSGTQAPVTYTRSTLGLAIPDDQPVGVMDTLNIPDDHEIADVDVRIDSVTHTFPGDLTFSVKGPNGYSSDFLAFLGIAVGAGNGDNIVNMRFDDEATGDVLLAANASAPYTGSWKPVFNSPTWSGIGFTGPDGTPQLSNFDGSSSLGNWTAIISDQAGVDVGTLQGWSLIVTPRNFVCTPFVPTAANASVSGRVRDAAGRGLSLVVVSLVSSEGEVRSTRTNTFGYFQFRDIPVGQTFALGAQARGYLFDTQLLTLEDNIEGIDIVGRR